RRKPSASVWLSTGNSAAGAIARSARKTVHPIGRGHRCNHGVVVMTSLTAPSSAEIAPFPTADIPTFAVASKTWMNTTQTHPLLTDANKTFCTALYFYFNCNHYRKTGELIAWPGWDTLITEFGLSKTTISESIERLERSRLLEVERGRYNRAAQKRAGNVYRVPLGVAQGSYFEPWQRSYFEPNQGSDFGQDSYESPSPLGEKKDSVKEEGLPRESQQELKPESTRFERYSDAIAEAGKRRAAFKRPSALNGGGR